MNEIRHASCVEFEGHGILLLGPSGSGKSDLALRLIAMGATLVADDQTRLCQQQERLVARAVETTSPYANALEVRGVGLLKPPMLAETKVFLAVALVQPETVERLPEARTLTIAGCAIPTLSLAAFEASTPAKIIAALRYGGLS